MPDHTKYGVFVPDAKYGVSTFLPSISLSKLSTSWGQYYHAILYHMKLSKQRQFYG